MLEILWLATEMDWKIISGRIYALREFIHAKWSGKKFSLLYTKN